ncbi:MAG: hypothetical protein V4667_09475 [Bacteroidota bacterium]
MFNKFLFLAFVLLFGNQAMACDCPPVKALIKNECGKFEVIALGKIELIEKCDGKNASAIFYINELYRGNNIQKSLEFEFDCASSCSMSFEKGEEWLLFLKQIDGKLIANLCDRNRKRIADSTEDFYATVLQSTLNDDIDFLKNNIGLIKIEQSANAPNNRMVDITKRENQWSNRWKTVIYLCFSLIGFAAIYYAFKKFVK